MGKLSTSLILKIVCLVVLFVVTVLGCHAHFQSAVLDVWKTPGFSDACGSAALPTCPKGAIPMERTFVAFTIICLILSTGSVIAGFLIDGKRLKFPDSLYHILAGLMLLIAGALMIIAAIKLDDFIIKDAFNLIGITSKTDSQQIQTLLSSKDANQYGLSLLTSQLKQTNIVDEIKKEVRKEMKYANKLAAGALAVLNGILYFATAAIIHKS